METFDVIVVGGGMAGVSIGCELAVDRRVLVLDMESTLAFHTTGRSAAMFLETYGGPAIRALTTASRAGLDDRGVLRPLPMLHIALAGRFEVARQLHADVLALVPDAKLLGAEEAAAAQPLLRADRVAGGVLEPGAMEIDVHELHQSFVRGLRARGGTIQATARVVSAGRRAGVWTVTDATGRAWQAPMVVDAAGAWADELAAVFGARRIGLRALRRSAFVVDAPVGVGPPMISEIEDTFYVKADAGRLLCSPADETPQEPGDARADEVEIARAIEVINTVTTLDVRHVRASWAGLRNFVSDRTPVVGFDPSVEGLFWFAAQGGYGIQTSPALARAGAALLRGAALPADIADRGMAADALAPGRAPPRP